MKAIRHYLRVYKQFISTSFAEAMSFRTSFVLLIMMDLFFYFSTLASVSILYDHVETIGDWNRAQLMFFMSFMLTMDQLHMTFVSESFWILSHKIRTGELDFDLLKPIHSIFNIFFRHVRPSTLLNTAVVWAALIYFGIQAELSWWHWPLLPIFLLMGFSLLLIIEIIITTLMFWIQEGLGINFLRMQMQQLARWPDFVYTSLSRKVLTVALPLLLIGSPQVHFIFDSAKWYKLIYLIIAMVIGFIIMIKFWAYGIKNYDSASS